MFIRVQSGMPGDMTACKPAAPRLGKTSRTASKQVIHEAGIRQIGDK